MSGPSTGAIPVVTLIEGSDQTLVAEALRRIIDEAVGDEDRSLVLEDYSGEEVDLAAVADACATPPFLTSRRVVVVREVGRWKTEEVAPLLTYLENPLETTALVLVAGGGQTPTKLAAAAKSQGRSVSTQVDSRATADWVEKRIRQSGIGLDGASIRALTDHLGEDPGRLVPIIDVLEAAFPAGERLQFEDIEPYLGQAGSVTPWAFTDSIDAGQVEAALTYLHRLLEGGARHPLVVLAVLHRHVTSLMKVDHPSIRSEGDAASAMGIAKGRSTYPAKKALKSARSWGSANIAEAVGLVADAELDLKGQSAWPEAAVLEVLVARLCRLARGGAGARRPSAARS